MPKSNKQKAITASQIDWTPYNPPAYSSYPSEEHVEARADFEDNKERLAEDFVDDLDRKVTKGAIGAATRDVGGVNIVWTNTLNRTSGRAQTVPSCKDPEDRGFVNVHGHKQFRATIWLATKVVTNEKRLYRTVAHEFCHLAARIVDNVKEAHGLAFMSWARRCEEAFPEKDFVITATHGYEIEYKYLWACSGSQKSSVMWEENDDGSWLHHIESGCGDEIKAHSKKVKTNTDRCKSCGGHLVQVKPNPSGSTNTDWHTYQKTNFRAAKSYLEKQGPTDIGMVSEQLGRWYQGYGSPGDIPGGEGIEMANFIAPPDEMDYAIGGGHHTFNTLKSDAEDDEEPLEYGSDYDSEESEGSDEDDDVDDLGR